MRPERLEYLQKKYEKKLNPQRMSAEELQKGVQKPGGGMVKGPGGGGRGGRNAMPVVKPKNVKQTVGRLFSYISQFLKNFDFLRYFQKRLLNLEKK